MRWENVRECNFCGSRDAKPFLSLATTNWYDNRPLQLSECANCRLVRATPRPEREDVYQHQLIGTAKAIAPLKRRLSHPDVIANHRRAIQAAASVAQRPVRTLYETGCGSGATLMGARTLGIEGEGNDVNLVAVKMLGELGFKVRHGFTGDLDFDGMKFDVVMSLGYLEETYEPLEDLKRSHALLNDGGAIYVRSFYLGCPEHRASGEAWKVFGAGCFYYYYPETLCAMIEAAGFKIVDSRLFGMAVVTAVRKG